MKVKKKQSSGSLKIDPKVLQEAKVLCKSKGWLLHAFATKAIKNEIVNQK